MRQAGTIATAAAVALLAVVLMLSATPGRVSADPRADTYSLALNIQQDGVPSGGEFTIEAIIERGGQPPYQAAQWQFSIDPEYVEVVRAERAPSAPEQCNFTSSNEERLLLGCIDLGGPNIDYSGTAYLVTMRCRQDADIRFELHEPNTFVAVGIEEQGAYHTHGDAVTCGGGGPDVIAPTATTAPQGPVPTLRPDVPRPGATVPPGGGSTPGAGSTTEPGAQLGTAAAASATVEAQETVSATAGRTATGTPPAGTVDVNDDDEDDDDGVPWPIVIAVAVVAALVAAGGGGYWWVRRRGGVT